MKRIVSPRRIVAAACLSWLAAASGARAAIEVELRILTLTTPSGTSTVASTAALESLPNRITEIGAGENFTVELWVSDVGSVLTGVTGLFVDLNYDGGKLRSNTLTHSVPFTFLQGGTINNPSGKVENFGGNDATLTGQAIAPTWSRIGHVSMTRIGGGPATIAPTLGLAGVGVLGTSQPSNSELQLGGALIGDTGQIGDCNANGIADSVDIADGNSLDCNENTLPDECEFPGCQDLTPGDLTCDGTVDGRDISPYVGFLTAGGYTCQADMNQDGELTNADTADFVDALLGGA